MRAAPSYFPISLQGNIEPRRIRLIKALAPISRALRPRRPRIFRGTPSPDVELNKKKMKNAASCRPVYWIFNFARCNGRKLTVWIFNLGASSLPAHISSPPRLFLPFRPLNSLRAAQCYPEAAAEISFARLPQKMKESFLKFRRIHEGYSGSV